MKLPRGFHDPRELARLVYEEMRANAPIKGNTLPPYDQAERASLKVLEEALETVCILPVKVLLSGPKDGG